MATNVIKLPGINGSALFGTVAGTNTRVTGCPFTAVSPGIKVIRIPSTHLTQVSRVVPTGGVIRAAFRFASVTKVIGNTDGNRKLNGGFLRGVHRISTVIRIIHTFSSRGVARISGGISPLSSVSAVGVRLILTSLRSIGGHCTHIRGITHARGSGSSVTRFGILSGVGPILRRNGPIHDLRFSSSRRGVIGKLFLLASGPILCITGVNRSSVTSPSSYRCCRRVGGFTRSRNSRTLTIYTQARRRVTRLSSSRGRRFLRTRNIRRSNLSHLVGTSCGLLNLTAFFATNNGRAHT